RTAGMLNLASALLLSGDASKDNERLLISTVASARPVGGSTLLTSVVALAALLWRQGRLRQAAVTYREAAEVVPEPAALLGIPNAASYYLGLGDLLREWNDLDAAERLLTQGRELVRGRLLAEADAVSQGYIALARLQQARGEASAALATLQEFEALAQERAYAAHLIARGVAAQAQVALRQGNLEPAVRWADTSGVRPNDEISYPQEFAYLTLARVRIAQGRREPSGPALPDALYLLDRLLSAAEAGMRMDSVIEILILQALVFEAQGDAPRALVPLARALTLAAPEGYVRVFLDEGAALVALLRAACAHGMVADYAAHLLTHADLSAPPAPAVPPAARRYLPEPLTERELDVLRLLAAGRSNQAIADELVVAVGTVKRHISSIMGKLQAESRLEAVARARDLQLL
ncbi:MAG TPA: LuxR C-terminal-related transcriptional regulator, partial [Myxococcaceae bacterium]|nr:LuxR C-terminal-related transcriptional regulator [Myxococcaceae bacterium]